MSSPEFTEKDLPPLPENLIVNNYGFSPKQMYAYALASVNAYRRQLAKQPVAAWRAPDLSGSGDVWAYRDANDPFVNQFNQQVGQALYTSFVPKNGQLKCETSDNQYTVDGWDITGVLDKLLAWSERQVCTHESTHRGGAIWTICDMCGKEWADDRGGFVPYEDPIEIKTARNVVNAMKKKRE